MDLNHFTACLLLHHFQFLKNFCTPFFRWDCKGSSLFLPAKFFLTFFKIFFERLYYFLWKNFCLFSKAEGKDRRPCVAIKEIMKVFS